jgi:cytochrome b561
MPQSAPLTPRGNRTMNSSAPPPNTRPVLRYDRTAITFHWITVILVVVVGVLGLLHDTWPRRSQRFWINLHALIGLTLWLLVMARLWWRSAHRPPALPPQSGAWSRRLSAPVHLLMYALLLVTPVLGIVTFIWHGRVFDFGLLRVDFGVPANRAIFHPTEDIHGYLAYALFTLVGLHVLAALWHHFGRRDALLLRMWPARSPPT